MALSTYPPDDIPLLAGYTSLPGTCDELALGAGPRSDEVKAVWDRLSEFGASQLRRRQRIADEVFLRGGVTFSVYADERRHERVFPFDLIPRVVTGSEWDQAERGLQQRVQALNAFLTDIYGEQRILEDSVIPRRLVLASEGYREQLRGISPPGGVYIHIAGIDLIRGSDGALTVLEDNVRTPSGVSYALENRAVMKRLLPDTFGHSSVRAIDAYPQRLGRFLSQFGPGRGGRVVVLTPGPYNSAYFEHSYLARRMGVELVHNTDLFVHDHRVFVKTTLGPQRVDVIYRRTDDDFLDPQFFRADSMLGVPGLVGCYIRGNVTLANALGNGVADDKAIYPFVPDMIRFYLSEEPILPQVRTYICERPSDLKYVLANLEKLVVKKVNESGGYGMLMGPSATRAELDARRSELKQNPRDFIAQPLIELSTCPTLIDGEVKRRRVDLRPYILGGQDPWVMPGGLTRVALRAGSYVVNSSQGGGSKDTWVLDGERS